jgi:hypothetical protein
MREFIPAGLTDESHPLDLRIFGSLQMRERALFDDEWIRGYLVELIGAREIQLLWGPGSRLRKRRSSRPGIQEFPSDKSIIHAAALSSEDVLVGIYGLVIVPAYP